MEAIESNLLDIYLPVQSISIIINTICKSKSEDDTL